MKFKTFQHHKNFSRLGIFWRQFSLVPKLLPWTEFMYVMNQSIKSMIKLNFNKQWTPLIVKYFTKRSNRIRCNRNRVYGSHNVVQLYPLIRFKFKHLIADCRRLNLLFPFLFWIYFEYRNRIFTNSISCNSQSESVRTENKIFSNFKRFFLRFTPKLFIPAARNKGMIIPKTDAWRLICKFFVQRYQTL